MMSFRIRSAVAQNPARGATGLGSEEAPVSLGDEETGTITFWVNTRILRMSLARLTNIANRFDALENVHRPERLGRVIRVPEMPAVTFEIIDTHGRIVIPFLRGAIEANSRR